MSIYQSFKIKATFCRPVEEQDIARMAFEHAADLDRDARPAVTASPTGAAKK